MSSEYASLDMSKKLADLFPDAKHWWFYSLDAETYSDDKDGLFVAEGVNIFSDRKLYPAITIQMALDVLPTDIQITRDGGGYIIRKYLTLDARVFEYTKSLPNALCKMILWLKENNFSIRRVDYEM